MTENLPRNTDDIDIWKNHSTNEQVLVKEVKKVIGEQILAAIRANDWKRKDIDVILAKHSQVLEDCQDLLAAVTEYDKAKQKSDAALILKLDEYDEYNRAAVEISRKVDTIRNRIEKWIYDNTPRKQYTHTYNRDRGCFS